MLDITFSDNSPSEWLRIAEEKLQQAKLDVWQLHFWQFVSQWFSDADSVLLQTSGSTGRPKQIYLSKQMMRTSAHKTLQALRLEAQQSALLCLSAQYIAGKMMIVRAIEGKLRLFVIAPSSLPLKDFPHPVHFAAMVPMQVFEQLKHQHSLDQIKKLIIGGGSLSSVIQQQLQNCQCIAFETYGMTETVSHIALRQINGAGKQSAFHPLPNVEIEQDYRNCLIIHSPDLLPHALLTTDVCELFSDGSFLLKGRVDNVINSGGIKIQPEEWEQKLSTLFSPFFALNSIPDPKLGQKLVLASTEEITAQQLQQANEQLQLSPPITYSIHIPEMPRTPTHKIDRRQLRKMLEKMAERE